MIDILDRLESQSIDLMAFSDPALLESSAGKLQAAMLMGRAEKVYQQAADTITALRQQLAEAVEMLARLCDVYGDMEDGDGNPCPDIRRARKIVRMAKPSRRKAKG